MANKQKYTLTSFRNNEVLHPNFIELGSEINVEDLITFYYYLLYPKHFYEGEVHDYYELFVCLGGKAHVATNDKVYLLDEKEFIITPPNQKHAHYPEHTFLSSVSISFSASGIDNDLICNKIGTLNQAELGVLDLLVNEYINNYELQGEYKQPYVKKVELKNEFAYKQMFKCALEILLIQITRQFKNPTSNNKFNMTQEQNENENEIIQYIKEHYKEKLLLEDIASHFNYSVGHLCRKFKSDTGGTIINYITKYRISMAMRLLFERKELNIDEIAYEVGFNDVQYFTNSFKKLVGTTPGKYRTEATATTAMHAQDIMFDIIKNIK